MSTKHSWKQVTAAAAGLAIIAAALLGRSSVYHLLPLAWTGEPARLAGLLRVPPGGRVAEIGAGSGAMAVEIATGLGPGGTVFATEIDPDRRQAIAARVRQTGMAGVRVVEAASDGTALPDACCEALYLRNVFHHIADQAAYARDIARTVGPEGRVVIIDLAPGTLWHLGPDHGVRPERVTAALTAAGFALDQRIDDWGGGMFAIAFRREAADARR